MHDSYRETGRINALLLGDVIGQPGCRALFIGLKKLIKEYDADIVVVNGENADDGFGLTPEIAEQFLTQGVDAITSGNHIWQKREILPTLQGRSEVLRPANYPDKAPGHGSCIIEKKGVKIAVLNLQGRVDLQNLDCPFRKAEEKVRKLKKETPLILVDFHAENVEEKEALGLFLDGSVSVVVGTHTHVQTADERILEKGTAYISDLGMTGPPDSVIGSEKETAIERVKTQLPLRMEIHDAPAEIQGVAVTLDVKTGKALSITRIAHKSAF